MTDGIVVSVFLPESCVSVLFVLWFCGCVAARRVEPFLWYCSHGQNNCPPTSVAIASEMGLSDSPETRPLNCARKRGQVTVI